MLIKLIGGAILLLSGVGAAILLCRYQRRRLETLDGLIALLFYVKGQVDCYARPLGEILDSIPREILGACGLQTAPESLEQVAEECRIYLDRESLRLLSAFASEFGTSFREEQVKRCTHYIGLLGEERDRCAGRVTAACRTGSTLCLCLSLCLLILLW